VFLSTKKKVKIFISRTVSVPRPAPTIASRMTGNFSSLSKRILKKFKPEFKTQHSE